jgi:hypothetical protein
VVGVAIGDDQRPSTFGDRFTGAAPEVLDRLGQPLTAAFDVVKSA